MERRHPNGDHRSQHRNNGDSEEQLDQRKSSACRMLLQSARGVLVWLDFAVHIILRQRMSVESFLNVPGIFERKSFSAFQHPCTETGDITAVTVTKQFLAWELLMLRISIAV